MSEDPFHNSITNAVGGRDNAIRLMWAGREITGEAKAVEALRAFGVTEAEIEVLRNEDSSKRTATTASTATVYLRELASGDEQQLFASLEGAKGSLPGATWTDDGDDFWSGVVPGDADRVWWIKRLEVRP